MPEHRFLAGSRGRISGHDVTIYYYYMLLLEQVGINTLLSSDAARC